MVSLDIKKIQAKHEKIENHKYRVYRGVLKECHKQIIQASDHGYQECIVTVPVFVFGMPSFNINDCAKFIVKSLIDDKFKCKVYEIKYINVSWKS